jgi:hypothetical protein
MAMSTTTFAPELDTLGLAELEELAQGSPDRAVRRRAASRVKALRDAGEPGTPAPRRSRRSRADGTTGGGGGVS